VVIRINNGFTHAKNENVKAQIRQKARSVKSGLLKYNKLMLEINIPGHGNLQLNHLVSDVNGTLAVDGVLMDGLSQKIALLRKHLTIHLLTADTHGGQSVIDQQLDLKAVRITPGNEARQKADYVRNLGVKNVAALGQGANDAEMLKAAGLGICVLSREGTAVETILAADLLMPDVFSALELFEKPMRIIGDLRK
jgi:soluble P-type ATPase